MLMRHQGRQREIGRLVRADLQEFDGEERKTTFGEDEMASVERIKEFLDLDVDELFRRDLTPREEELLREAATFVESKPDTRNRRVAMAMMGLEKAVRKLYHARDWKEPDTQQVDLSADGELTAWQAGSDFGMGVDFTYSVEGRLNERGNALDAQLYVLLPQDHYLFCTLQLGDPHEPVFFAREPDFISPEWSKQDAEWLENGGKTFRRINPDRSIYDEKSNYISDTAQQRKDIFRRDAIDYFPLYSTDAPGADRYLAIVQELLARFLDAAGKREIVN